MYLPHALRASSSSKNTSWFPSTVYNSIYGSDSCIDSSGNSYVTISYGVRTIVQKIGLTGTVVWEKIIGTTGFDVIRSLVALSPDGTTLYIAQNSARVNGANYCVELISIYTSDGTQKDTGYVYYATGKNTTLTSFTYNANATDGKKLVFVVNGNWARFYTSTSCTMSFFVDPTNFVSYRQSYAIATADNNVGYMLSYSAVIVAGGTTFMCVKSSLWGYGIVGINTSGLASGSIKLQGNGTHSSSIATNASGYAYCDFSTGTGNIGITKVSSSFAFQWATQVAITNATTNPATVGRNVYVDSSGNVYSASSFQNSTGNQYIIVFKINSSGTVQWIKKFESTAGALAASSITGNANYLTVGGLFGSSNNAFGLTLSINGANIDGTYTGVSGIGNMVVSTPAYTVTSLADIGALNYVSLENAPFNSATSTNAASNSVSVGVTPVLLPYV